MSHIKFKSVFFFICVVWRVCAKVYLYLWVISMVISVSLLTAAVGNEHIMMASVLSQHFNLKICLQAFFLLVIKSVHIHRILFCVSYQGQGLFKPKCLGIKL